MSLISRHGTSRGYRADGSVCTCSCHDGIGVHIAACCSVAPPDTSSAGAGDAYPTASDREVLQYLMQQFDAETWECPRCGHSEDCKTMDSADYLRRYLASPIAGDREGEVANITHAKGEPWRSRERQLDELEQIANDVWNGKLDVSTAMTRVSAIIGTTAALADAQGERSCSEEDEADEMQRRRRAERNAK